MFARKALNINRYQILLKYNNNLNWQNAAPCCRSLHLVSRGFQNSYKILQIIKAKQCFYPYSISTSYIRHHSNQSVSNHSGSDVINLDAIPQIPDAPSAVPASPEIEEVVAKVSELQSLGIGGWSPSGMAQEFLYYIHDLSGVPWWITIACATLAARTLLFPIVIISQRNIARMSNIMPGMQAIQEELSEARKMGDRFEVARLSHELHSYMKTNNVKPFRSMLVTMCQAPIFISFFFGLRGMVSVPIESMKYEGLWWFTDLTVPDPYYLLPFVTCSTLFLTFELGGDSIRAQNMGVLKYVLRVLPIVMFPFVMNFEGAILCYWVSTNFFTLAQVALLRIPAVRMYFKIPPTVKHEKKDLPISRKGFAEGLKDSWTNIKVSRQLNERIAHQDEAIFEAAGKGPIPKTYKEDPTKRHPLTNAILAKKR